MGVFGGIAGGVIGGILGPFAGLYHGYKKGYNFVVGEDGDNPIMIFVGIFSGLAAGAVGIFTGTIMGLVVGAWVGADDSLPFTKSIDGACNPIDTMRQRLHRAKEDTSYPREPAYSPLPAPASSPTAINTSPARPQTQYGTQSQPARSLEESHDQRVAANYRNKQQGLRAKQTARKFRQQHAGSPIVSTAPPTEKSDGLLPDRGVNPLPSGMYAQF